MKKTLKFLAYVCIAFLIVYNLVILIKKIKNKEEVPSFLGYKNFIILSGSMEPTLNVGDVIFIKEKVEIQENDIISFKEGSSIITHRVIEKVEQNEQEMYRTKGDANKSADQKLISVENIEGVYLFKIPRIGMVIAFLQSKVGIIIFLVLLFLVYIYINKSTSGNNDCKQ